MVRMVQWQKVGIRKMENGIDQNSGAMQVGWTLVNGVYYYLNPTANIQNRPYGSMYQSEQTPDNYRVNENGAWIQ